MRILVIILCVFFFSVKGGQVVVVSKTRANNLKGKEATDDLLFNPVLDSLGRWCVSKEEIDQLDDSIYWYLKSMKFIEFIPPKDTVTQSILK